MGRKATLQELADAVGVGTREGARQLRKKGMPQDVAGAKAWYANNIKGGSDGAEEGSDGSAYGRKLAAEALCKEADAAKKQLDLQRMRGELVERAAVKSTMRKMVTTMVNRIEAIPDELATLFPPDQRASIIADVRETIRLALTELAALDDYLGDD